VAPRRTPPPVFPETFLACLARAFICRGPQFINTSHPAARKQPREVYYPCYEHSDYERHRRAAHHPPVPQQGSAQPVCADRSAEGDRLAAGGVDAGLTAPAGAAPARKSAPPECICAESGPAWSCWNWGWPSMTLVHNASREMPESLDLASNGFSAKVQHVNILITTHRRPHGHGVRRAGSRKRDLCAPASVVPTPLIAT